MTEQICFSNCIRLQNLIYLPQLPSCGVIWVNLGWLSRIYMLTFGCPLLFHGLTASMKTFLGNDYIQDTHPNFYKVLLIYSHKLKMLQKVIWRLYKNSKQKAMKWHNSYFSRGRRCSCLTSLKRYSLDRNLTLWHSHTVFQVHERSFGNLLLFGNKENAAFKQWRYRMLTVSHLQNLHFCLMLQSVHWFLDSFTPTLSTACESWGLN